MYSLEIYDEQFFADNQAEGLRHAIWFIPLLIKVFNPNSLIDVGCGTGHFVQSAHAHGIEAWGCEGAPFAISHLLRPNWICPADLRKPFEFGKLDLAISIEVAEHIEREYASIFVDTLCGLSDTIVMTAAPPGQGGLQHVNEQPRQYWRQMFAQRGFEVLAPEETKLMCGIVAARSAGHHVASWFEPNIQVYGKTTGKDQSRQRAA